MFDRLFFLCCSAQARPCTAAQRCSADMQVSQPCTCQVKPTSGTRSKASSPSAYSVFSICLFLSLRYVYCLQALEVRVREEQRMMDKKIVSEIDQKVIDQQNTLEKAGVPGFFITTNPQVSSLFT